MATPTKTWLVGSLGLTEGEKKLLQSLATLTRSRAEGSYVIGTAENAAQWQMIVVNMEDPTAIAEWEKLASGPSHPARIQLGAANGDGAGQYRIARPFGPAKLLPVLDSISKNLADSAQLWEKPVARQSNAASQENSTQRALVVDDSPTVTRQIELELRQVNVQADLAETGERALELVALNKYDLIFLDVVLPGTDGYSVCKELRKNPRTKQTPVIMLTSKSSPFDKVRGSLAGCSAYLTKPVDYTEFRAALEKYIKL